MARATTKCGVALLFLLLLVSHIPKALCDDKKSGNDLNLNPLVNFLEKLPVVGADVKNVVDSLVIDLNFINETTNGAIAEVFGGALPCVVSLDGVSCKGRSLADSLSKGLIKVIDGLPSTLIPNYLKLIMDKLTQSVVIRILEFLFGRNA